MKHAKLTRRTFIQQTSLATVVLAGGQVVLNACTTGIKKGEDSQAGIPRRTLGNTGMEISILGYGGGSQFMKMPDGEWEPHLEYAVKAGINYFDTASTYGIDAPRTSQMRFGEILPSYRKDIILLTKVHDRDPDAAMKEFETSLQQLKTDYVDILLIHAIGPGDDVSSIDAGTYRVVQRLKEEKLVRFIGFSSMDSAERSRDLIENLDFDVTLLAMNPTNYGNFSQVALPAAREKNMGVIAMKVMRDIVNAHAGPKELLDYAWSLEGVHCALVSHTGMDPLDQNIQLASAYRQAGKITGSQNELEHRLAHLSKPGLLCYSRPGYYDGMLC